MGITSFVNTKFIYSCTEKKTIALTFDDGPHKYTKDLVEYVKTQPDVKITFFTVGKFHYPFATDVKEYQRAMRKAHRAGFQIASHTYKHKIPKDLEEFRETLNDMDDFIEEVTGDRPHYFRAPKGHCDKNCQESLDDWGYHLIQWDTDTRDWDLESSGSVKQRVKDSIKYLEKKFSKEQDSYLILMHDTQNYTVHDIVPWILEESGMKEKGYRFVTVAECLGNKAGMYVSGNTYGDEEMVANATNTMVATNATSTTETVIANPIVHIETAENNDTSIDNMVMNDYIHNLKSGATSMKPYSVLLFLCFGLLMLLF